MKALSIIGIILAVLVAGALLYVALTTPPDTENLTGDAYPSHPYVEIVKPSGFVNTDGITLGELVGKKVILVEFLTYSCINCQRTFPYVVGWYEKYRDEGLEIVGIHTPEFAFEQDIDNVRMAMQKFGIEYPIVLDNEYETWRAYGNKYWPRKYLIDINGNVVYDHIGEGAYEETESKIRELLRERADTLGEAPGPDTLAGKSVDVKEVIPETASPETYFGYARNEYLGNGTAGQSGQRTYTLPSTLEDNKLYLEGTWDIEAQAARAISDAVVRYQYTAKEVYVVASSDSGGEIEVWQDGAQVTNLAGADVVNGVARIGEARLYKLIRNSQAGAHTLELRVKGTGTRIYTFTFG